MSEDRQPEVKLLGAASIAHAGGVSTFTPERPFLLLAYLACRGDWVTRDELADLLWPGREMEAARSNLRKVLHLARRIEGVQGLEQQGELLRWAPESDLLQFRRAVQSARLEDAIAAYGGPLLDGIHPARPAEAARWLAGERDRLEAMWRQACSRRLAELADRPEQAQAVEQMMLRHRTVAAGRRAAAAQRDAARQDESGDADSATSSTSPISSPTASTPRTTSPLIGRRQELAQIRERISRSECRVLTVLGTAGVGKSTLARAALAELGDSAMWVPLEDLSHPDQVPSRIASLLGLTLDGAHPAWDSLGFAMGEGAQWLVLDNAEHLDIAAGLAALLVARPAVRVLAASREPLNVPGEWRLPLEGLPLPDADETDAQVLRLNDSVRLFESRALQVAPSFNLSAEAADVVRLVHEVDGLPLAIELLAAWRRLMPVREVLAELAGSLEVLEPVRPSERSVRASFANAWRRLDAAEQRVLSQLAVLPSPVTREMARVVLQAPLAVLASLADHSLLRAGDDGAFLLHPLVRRCAQALAGDVEAVGNRHAHFVAHLLDGFKDDPNTALRETGRAIAHVRAAWRWASEHADAALINRLAGRYRQWLLDHAQWAEGLAAMEAARKALAARTTATVSATATSNSVHPEEASAVATVHCESAMIHFAAGQLDAALSDAAQALEIASRCGARRTVAAAHGVIASTHWQRGEYQASGASSTRQLQIAREDGNRRMEEVALTQLALVKKNLGRYEEALVDYQAALDIAKQEALAGRQALILNNMGNLLRVLGRPRDALAAFQEGLNLCRLHALESDEPFLKTNVGMVHEHLGEFGQALLWGRRALEVGRVSGEPMIQAAALLLIARSSAAGAGTAARDPTAAFDAVWESLAIAERLKSNPLRLECIAAGGVVAASIVDRAEGIALLGWVRRQEAFSRSEREDLQRHLHRLAVTECELTQAAAALPEGASVQEVVARLSLLAEPSRQAAIPSLHPTGSPPAAPGAQALWTPGRARVRMPESRLCRLLQEYSCRFDSRAVSPS